MGKATGGLVQHCIGKMRGEGIIEKSSTFSRRYFSNSSILINLAELEKISATIGLN